MRSGWGPSWEPILRPAGSAASSGSCGWQWSWVVLGYGRHAPGAIEAIPCIPASFLWALLGVAFVLGYGSVLLVPLIPPGKISHLLYLALGGFAWAMEFWGLAHMDRWRWRACFGIWLAARIMERVAGWLIVIYLPGTLWTLAYRGGPILLSLLRFGVVWPVIAEYREGMRRPWSHWVGVFLWLSYAAVFLVFNLFFLG